MARLWRRRYAARMARPRTPFRAGHVGGFPRPDRSPAGRDAFSISEILPPYDPGPWPEGFTASREQIYGDEER